MMKKCNFCSETKPVEDFGKATRNVDGLNNRCKQCYYEYRKNWYGVNIETHKENTARNTQIKIQAIHEWLGDYLLSHPCVDCGNDDVLVLEFDHINDDKEDHVSRIVRKGNLEKVQTEVAKCEVRCVNCHRKITNKRRRGLGNV